MKKKVTSTDIAHAAGVSQSTVSMILNKKYDVSFAKDTVERVENAAKELGYVPPKRKTRKGTKREKLLVVFCPIRIMLCCFRGLRHMRKKKVSAFLYAIRRETSGWKSAI